MVPVKSKPARGLWPPPPGRNLFGWAFNRLKPESFYFECEVKNFDLTLNRRFALPKLAWRSMPQQQQVQLPYSVLNGTA